MEITLTIPPEKEAQVMTWFLSVHPNDRHVTVQQPNPEYVSPEETRGFYKGRIGNSKRKPRPSGRRGLNTYGVGGRYNANQLTYNEW